MSEKYVSGEDAVKIIKALIEVAHPNHREEWKGRQSTALRVINSRIPYIDDLHPLDVITQARISFGELIPFSQQSRL